MKICFNSFPPAKKLFAILAAVLLLLSYAKLKAENKIGGFNTNGVSLTKIKTGDLNTGKQYCFTQITRKK